ncbi:MAG: lipocalin family protein [Pyrinomonadaceae bacterium]
MENGFFDPFTKFTSDVVDNVTNAVFNNGSDLHRRTATPRIDLPLDLFAHTDVQTEWWYYTGHCETESKKRFGFELAFFKRRTDLDKFGIVPLRLIANPMYAAHFAISEIGRKKFQYDHLRSFGSMFDLQAKMSEEEFLIELGPWSVKGDGDDHILHATFSDGLVFDARLHSQKPAVLHGLDGSGVSERDKVARSHHFSFTRMDVSGTIKKNGKAEEFKGVGWMDREFGTWETGHWDWFSIQLEDETELMLYHLRDLNNGRREFSHGRFIREDGSSQYLSNDDFELTATGEWTSPKTGAVYPSGWHVSVPKLQIDLDVSPMFEHQELDTRGTSMVIYWEGACEVKGTKKGRKVKGNSYVELVGYDLSHQNPSLLSFFLGKSFQV